MNKFLTKLAKLFLGMAMAAGVGVAVGSSNKEVSRADAADITAAGTYTYTFTSKSWGATKGGTAANWTSGKDGAGFSNNGIQVTTAASGAYGTSPDSFNNVTNVILTYNTNKSKGSGTAVVKIGSNAETSQAWAYSTGDGTSANYTLSFDYATAQSGAIKITLNTSANSIYLVSCAITQNGSGVTPTPTTYSVTYDDNGATSGTAPTDSNSPYISGATVTVLGNTGNLAKTGYTFDGWNTDADGSGTGYAEDDEFEISANTTLYAQWAAEASVTYEWQKMTSTSEFVNGAILLITQDSYFLDASQAATGNTPKQGSLTLVNNLPTLTASKDYCLTVSGSGSTIKLVKSTDSTKYLYTNTSNNGTRIGSASEAGMYWTISNANATDHTFYLASNASTTRYLSRYGTTDFRSYTNTDTAADLTIYKLVEASGSHTVTFISDGGTAYEPVSVDNGDSITLPTPEKTNYYFLGWKVFDGESVSGDYLTGSYTPTTNVTLKAQWAYSALHITYDGNGATSGSVPEDNTTYAYNGTVTVLGNTGSLAIAHKTFNGWNTAQDGSGANYSAGGTFTIQADVTLYAVWTTNAVVSMRNVNNSVPSKTEYKTTETFEPEGLVIYATYSGEGEDETNIASQITWNALVEGTSVTGTYGGQSITISGLTIYTPGTADHPYSVDDARNAATTTATESYVKGIIYNVGSYNSQYSSLTYWISDDGTGNTTNKDGLQIYSGKGLNGADFSSADDLKVGWTVVVKGDLKIFQTTTYELDKNSQILSIEKPVSELIIDVENNEMSISGSDVTAHTIEVMIDEDATDQKVNIAHQSGTSGLFTKSSAQITCVAGSGSFTLTGTGAITGSETFRISANGNSSIYVDLVVNATDEVYNNVTMSITGYHLSGTASVVQGSDVELTIVAEAKYSLPTSISILDEYEQAISEEWTYSNGELLIESLEHDVHISFSPVAADKELIVSSAKTDFLEGDEFTTGEDIVVEVVYDDAYSTSETVSLWDGEDESTGYKVNSNAYNPNRAGTYDIIVTYAGLSDTYQVTVTGVVRYTYNCSDQFDNGLLECGTGYSAWSEKSVSGGSNAVYAGNSASPKDTSEIQLRATNPSGIVSTTSGGLIKKITVEWGPTLTTGRILDVYVSNQPFASAGDLYNAGSGVIKIGSITYVHDDSSSTTTELSINDSYRYVGVRSNSGALYLSSVQFDWTEDVAAESDVSEVNDFITTFMQPNISPSNKGTGECVSEGWYEDARDYFNDTLTDRQKAIVLTSTSYAITSGDNEWYYNQIKERLIAWASAYGESLDTSTNTFKHVKINTILSLFNDNSNSVAIIVIISMVSMTAIGGYFFIRKRKEQ